MSVSVLTKKQQKKSLSGIKNRKKAQKNILAAPDNVKVSKLVLNETYIQRVTATLENLLPNARLPRDRVQNVRKLTDTVERSNNITEEASLKSQLLLGINSVSRGVNNGSVACILFADDVRPKLLINHLIVLCSLKSIPYLSIENLRDLTKRTLGFSCIALGFKNNSTIFSTLITLVQSAREGNKDNLTIQPSVDNAETSEVQCCEEESQILETNAPFTYLYRNSNMKRLFVPDSNGSHLDQKSSMSFISIEPEDEISTSFSSEFRTIKSKRKSCNLNKNFMKSEMNSKIVKTEESGFQIEYSATEIIKMEANPGREKKRFIKIKKKGKK